MKKSKSKSKCESKVSGKKKIATREGSGQHAKCFSWECMLGVRFPAH